MRRLLVWAALLAVGCSSSTATSSTSSSVDNSAAIPTPGPVVAARIIDAAGGTLTVTDPTSPVAGTAIVVPAGALAGPVNISITPVAGPTGVITANIGPTGTLFRVPATVTLPYTQGYLNANNISDPSTLKIVVSDPAVPNQTLRTISQDATHRTITARTTHLSNFAVIGYSKATLSGTYTYVNYFRNSSVSNPVLLPLNVPSTPNASNLTVPLQPKGFTVEFGKATFDGLGNVTMNATRNTDGVITAVNGSGAYTVAPDGTVSLPGGLTGNVLAGGSTFVYSSGSGDPEIGVGVQTVSAVNSSALGFLDTSALGGTYSFVDFFHNSNVSNNATLPLSVPGTPFNTTLNVPYGPKGASSEGGNTTLNGAIIGTLLTVASTRNQDGILSAQNTQGAYSVNPDLTITLPGGLKGVITTGAGFLFASLSGDPEMGYGGRPFTGLDLASVKGTYAYVDYFRNSNVSNNLLLPVNVPNTPFSNTLSLSNNPRGYTVERGTVTLDGAGGLTLIFTRNQDGVVTSQTLTGTYSVAADGSITLPGGLKGTVLENGSSFIFSSTNGDPEFGVAILK